MQKTTKDEILEALKDYGVISRKNLSVALQEYGVLTKQALPLVLKESGVLTKQTLPLALKDYGVATKDDISKSERRTALRLTKVKNALADRIANIALAKEERSKVEKIEKRVTNLENFKFA